MKVFTTIGKKVYGTVGLLVFSTVIVLMVAIAALHAIDALVALTRAERDHTVHYYQAVSKFEKYVHDQDERLMEEMEAHLEITLGESKAFGSITEDVRAKSIQTVAAELDARFPTVDAWQSRNIVIMAKLFSGNPILMDLVEISRKAYQSASRYLEIARAYRAAESDHEKGVLLAEMDEINRFMDSLPEHFSKGVQDLSAWALSLVQKALIGVFLIFSVTAAVIAAKVIGSVTGPLREVVEFSEQMAKGDFSRQITLISHDETGQLIRAVNRICRDVGESIRKIGKTSRTVSEGAETQSAYTQQTAAALEQLTAQIKGTAAHAKEANGLTREAVEIVKEADGLMETLIVSMGRLSRNSADAQGIIKTIDEIAFQTNLLALNASVEAARAGGAGQGFAVVAGEVKKLAMRSAQAAKNTQELIQGMTEKIDQGTVSVENTAAVFEKLSQNIDRIGDLIREITDYSDEQARGIDGIGQAVNEIDRVVGDNAKSAKELAQDIGLFKTDGNRAGKAREIT